MKKQKNNPSHHGEIFATGGESAFANCGLEKLSSPEIRELGKANNMDGLEQRQYIRMDTEELEDLLISIRHDIARKIKTLANDFRALTRLQEKQEKVETRLEELGGTIGRIKRGKKYPRREEEGAEEEEE